MSPIPIPFSEAINNFACVSVLTIDILALTIYISTLAVHMSLIAIPISV